MKSLLCVVLTLCLTMVSHAADTVELLKPQNFATGLAGWISAGQAEFAADAQQTYNGMAAARLTVAPGVAPSYQQLQWKITDVAADDEFQGAVWVKTRGVTKNPGAYAALEYLDADGKRVGLDQGMGHITDAPDWQRISLRGYAPKGVKSARLNLILHENGTAWFAAPELKRIRPLPPGPELGFQEITINPKAVIRDRFLGFGVEWDSRGYDENGITNDDFAMIRQRIEWMRLPIVRIMMQAKWCYKGNNQFDWDTPEMKSLYRHLDLCQARGISVILTDWGVEPQWLQAPDIRDVGDPKYAEVIGAYMKHLVERKAYRCLKYFVMVNEPNLEVREWNRWKSGVQNVAVEFRKQGLDKKVVMMGSDQSAGDSWHLMAVDQLQSTLGAYDIHSYVTEPLVRRGRVYDYYREMWKYALDKDPRAANKPLIVAESGVTGAGASSSQNPLTADYDYGVWMADYAVQAANAGSWAVLSWMLDDNSHTGFTWGMWKSKKEGLALKPWFYTWSLLSRTVPPGSKLFRIAATNPNLRILAAQLPATPVETRGASRRKPAELGWSFCVVNRGQNVATIKLKVPGAKAAAMSRFLYSRTASATSRDGLPIPVSETRVNMTQGLEITCPPDAVVFVTATK